jgi:tRNA(Ile)-lysidine synthase
LLVRSDQPLVLAHLNHQLRGQESMDDEQFVQQLHQSLSCNQSDILQVRTARRDVAALATATGMNVEATARRCRYDWLVQVASEAGAVWLATGHTADDQAETVVHRLLRGTGIRGLRGIAPRWLIRPEVTVIRPLLRVTRDEVQEFLVELKQPFREDASNLDLKYTRNRIRHGLLPLLAEQYNPAIRSLLGRLAAQSNELFDDLQLRAVDLLSAAERPAAGTLRILDRQQLAKAAPLLAREALRQLWEHAGWPLGAMTFEKWDRLLAVCRADLPAVDLPGGIRARLRETVVQIGPAP